MIITEKTMPTSRDLLEMRHFIKALFIMSDGKYRSKTELAMSLSSSPSNRDLVDIIAMKGIIQVACKKCRTDYYELSKKGRALADMLKTMESVMSIGEGE